MIYRYGFKCRYLGGHFQTDASGNLILITDEERKARTAVSSQELNFIGGDVQKQLRSKKVRNVLFLFLAFGK